MAGTVVDAIVSFLRGKGLSGVAIAGILGNAQIESSFRTTALNQREGAIGLFQWEGSRRTNLQAYARSRGASETDLGTQLNFFWRELSGMPQTLYALQHAGSAASAAAIFDIQFERSSGSSRNERMAAAQRFLRGGLHAIQGSGSFELANGSGSSALTRLSPEDYQQALGALAGLLQSVPELNALVQQAVSSQWSANKFQQMLQRTKWYRSHSDSARQFLAMQVADPATARQNLKNQQNLVSQIASQLGVKLLPATVKHLATLSLMESWSQQTLQNSIGAIWIHDNRLGRQTGFAAQTQAQLKETAGNYGVPLTNAYLTHWTDLIMRGAADQNAWTDFVKSQAKSMYPGLAGQIDQGIDVKTAATPYVNTMANLLELDPASIDLMNGTIRRTLQGVPDGKGNRTLAPMWQFERTVRDDPRWQFTNNARQAAAAIAMRLGQDWKFGF